MHRRDIVRRGALLGLIPLAGCLGDEDEEPNDTDADVQDDTENDFDDTDDDEDQEEFVDVAIEEVADHLHHPWALTFLPDEQLLVTERDGDLLLVDRHEGTTSAITGVPDRDTVGQGGLLDLALHPSYPDEEWVYLTYSAADADGATATHLSRGRLNVDDRVLEDVEELHVVEPFVPSSGHYGSRVIFGPDENLYMTSGDRQFKDFGPDHVSQDTSNTIGTTIRLEPDGAIPADNPFLDEEDVVDAIYSYGHRNAQGMAVHPETGEIWQSEHGEEDGDELNVIEAGGNYGWPIAHTGCEYGSEEPIGDHPEERDDLVDPVYFWECGTGGFPPAGMTFYDADTFPQWDGHLFVGNLAGRYLGQFTVDGHEVEEVDPLLSEEGWRIRAVEVEPETGHLYILVDEASAPLIRLVPA